MSKGSNAGRVQVRKYHAFGGHREGITEVAEAQTPTELKTENIPPGVKYVASTGKALLSLLKLKHLQSSSPKISSNETWCTQTLIIHEKTLVHANPILHERTSLHATPLAHEQNYAFRNSSEASWAA